MSKRWQLALSAFVLLAVCLSAKANTTAMGLTLGKTTLKEFTKAYPSSLHEGRSKWSDGDIFSIPIRELGLEGVKSNAVIFNKSGKITAIMLELDKNRFDEVQSMLAHKYVVQKKQISFAGDKYAKYQNNNDVIELDAPYMSPIMKLTYSEQMFQEAYLNKSAEQLDRR
ncbi:MAG: hypothetical protein RSE29_20510 [Leclercia sp.]